MESGRKLGILGSIGPLMTVTEKPLVGAMAAALAVEMF